MHNRCSLLTERPIRDSLWFGERDARRNLQVTASLAGRAHNLQLSRLPASAFPEIGRYAEFSRDRSDDLPFARICPCPAVVPAGIVSFDNQKRPGRLGSVQIVALRTLRPAGVPSPVKLGDSAQTLPGSDQIAEQSLQYAHGQQLKVVRLERVGSDLRDEGKTAYERGHRRLMCCGSARRSLRSLVHGQERR